MTISCGALIDRFVQLQMFANPARCQVHDLAHCLFDHGVSDLTILVPGVQNQPIDAYGLDSEGRSFDARATGGGVSVHLTGPMLDAVSSTVVLDLEGVLKTR